MPKVPVKKTYNQEKPGVYGELGEGANAVVRYVQTAVRCEDLDALTLIETIPGSERWDVRDLFQRDVDKERVTQSILPYLKDETKVKFFNPITLILLPMEENSDAVAKDLNYAEELPITDNEDEYLAFERPGCFRFKVHAESPAYSFVEWNDQKVKVVAIDGQHRLSALKRWKNEPHAESKALNNWSIPVIILGVFKSAPDAETANLLEVCRKTFLYINTRAEEVNEARQILMDDESINAVCTQELIQKSHANDQAKKRDDNLLPLLFFDWRGGVKWKNDVIGPVRDHSPAKVKTIEEIHDWFENFLLGDDGGDYQRDALDLGDTIPPIENYKRLTQADSDIVRKNFLKTMYPGLTYLLTHFTPYADYIAKSRKIEKGIEKSDARGHAFSQLRFGSSRATADIFDLVKAEYDNLIDDFTQIKDEMPELIALDIGMRGVIYSFSELYEYFCNDRGNRATWKEYAEWFTPALNAIYEEGWFKSFDDLDRQKRDILTHVAFKPNGQIENYKLGDVKDALGSLVTLIICSVAELADEIKAQVGDEYSENLRKPLKRGLRSMHKAQLRDFVGTEPEKNAEIKKRTEKSTTKQIREIRRVFNFE